MPALVNGAGPTCVRVTLGSSSTQTHGISPFFHSDVSLCSWVHQTQKNEDFQSTSETEVLLFAPDTCSQLSSGLRDEIDLCPNLGLGVWRSGHHLSTHACQPQPAHL